MSFRLGTASAKIRRSRSESHSDAYDADDGEELFIPRNVKNGIFYIKTSRYEIISLNVKRPIYKHIIHCLPCRIFRC